MTSQSRLIDGVRLRAPRRRSQLFQLFGVVLRDRHVPPAAPVMNLQAEPGVHAPHLRYDRDLAPILQTEGDRRRGGVLDRLRPRNLPADRDSTAEKRGHAIFIMMRINLLVTLPGSRCLYNPYAGVQKEVWASSIHEKRPFKNGFSGGAGGRELCIRLYA